MNLLLINPKNCAATARVEVPPMGLAYIASAAHDVCDHVRIIDYDLHPEAMERFEDTIVRFAPDFVGITATSAQMPSLNLMVSILRARLPYVKIMVGGPHPTVAPEEVMKNNGAIDFCVVGEGEETVREILLGRVAASIQGIVYREGEEIKKTGPRKLMENLDTYPVYDRDMFEWWDYPGFYSETNASNFAIISSRGCPFACRFCASSKVFGRGHRRRSVESVVHEIKELIKKYHAKEVSFFDDLFTANSGWLRDFCHKLIHERIAIRWKCLSRVDTVDYELLMLMKNAGCWLICYGIESGDEETLKTINKKVDLKIAESACFDTRRAGIKTFHFYMIGNEGETHERFLNTIKFAKKTRPDFYQLGIVTPFPGSALYEDYKGFCQQNYGDLNYNIEKFAQDEKCSPGCEMNRKEMEELIKRFKEQLFQVGSLDWHEFYLQKRGSEFDVRIIGERVNKFIEITVINVGNAILSEYNKIRIGLKYIYHGHVIKEDRIIFKEVLACGDKMKGMYKIQEVSFDKIQIGMVKENDFWFHDIARDVEIKGNNLIEIE